MTTTQITAHERRAITALMDSSVMVKAKKEHRAEQAARRKAVRARRANTLPEVQQGIAKAAALMDRELQTCSALFAQLNGARARHRAAQTEWWGLTNTLEHYTNQIERDLGDLADERCAPVDAWLQSLIHRARADARHWTETQKRTVEVKGTFGLVDREIAELLTVTNLEQIKALCDKLADYRNQVLALVMESDAPDIGPDLKRIRDEALEAINLAAADGSVRLGVIPELNIED